MQIAAAFLASALALVSIECCAKHPAFETPISIAKRPVIPGDGVPKEALLAGLASEPLEKPSPTDRVAAKFKAVKDTTEYGPLSTLMDIRVSSVHLTYSDPKQFRKATDAQDYLRRLIATSSGSSYTWMIWSQSLDRPFLTADVEHTDANRGKLLLWYERAKGYFVCQDGAGKWWFGLYELDSDRRKK